MGYTLILCLIRNRKTIENNKDDTIGEDNDTE